MNQENNKTQTIAMVAVVVFVVAGVGGYLLAQVQTFSRVVQNMEESGYVNNQARSNTITGKIDSATQKTFRVRLTPPSLSRLIRGQEDTRDFLISEETRVVYLSPVLVEGGEFEREIENYRTDLEDYNASLREGVFTPTPEGLDHEWETFELDLSSTTLREDIVENPVVVELDESIGSKGSVPVRTIVVFPDGSEEFEEEILRVTPVQGLTD